MDSATSSHISKVRSHFIEFEAFDRVITCANSTRVKSVGKGVFRIGISQWKKYCMYHICTFDCSASEVGLGKDLVDKSSLDLVVENLPR